MKISEAISKLQSILETEGDITLVSDDSHSCEDYPARDILVREKESFINGIPEVYDEKVAYVR